MRFGIENVFRTGQPVQRPAQRTLWALRIRIADLDIIGHVEPA